MSKQKRDIIPRKGARLFVDIGNSSLKAAFTGGQGWTNPHRAGLQTVSDFADWVNRYRDRFDLVIVISVVGEMTDALFQHIEPDACRLLTIEDIPAELIDYDTPGSLGLDRFFGCYGAVAHSQKPAVVVDAGSACTVDYMASDFVYRGGVIMPGLGIMEEALKRSIPALPGVERDIPGQWPGRSTQSCLQWGLTGGFLQAIEGMMDRHREKFGDFDVVVTGGHAELIAGNLDREVKVRPSVIFDGMREFLNDYL